MIVRSPGAEVSPFDLRDSEAMRLPSLPNSFDFFASSATFCHIIKKEDGEIDIKGDARKNYLAYLAHQDWPGTYFFVERKGIKMRVIVKQAFWENNTFQIKRVLPEGGREMDYADFLRGN
jgi:hypothetical protein